MENEPYRFSVAPGVMTDNVDPGLLATVREASRYLPDGYTAKLTSGYRPGDPRFHGSGQAVDVQLYDDKGNPVPNYQSASNFRTYEQFAQTVHKLAPQFAPNSPPIRWGGYFPGKNGKDPFTGKDLVYGATDLMHFDTGLNGQMGGGTWEDGLTPQQRKFIPGAVSVGLNDGAPNPVPTDATAFDATKPITSPALKAITATNTPAQTPDDPTVDFPGASEMKKSTADEADFMKDFPGASAMKAAAPTSSAPAQTATAPSGVDDSFLRDFPASPAPIATAGLPSTDRMAGAVPGPNGLLWNQNGGFDPKSGELIVAGKPMDAGSATTAASTGFLNGIPVIGPALVGGVQRGAAAIRSIADDMPFSNAFTAAQSLTDHAAENNPKLSTGANIGGAVGGTMLGATALPAAFGVAKGVGLAGNMLTGAAGGAAVNAADSAVRNGPTLGNVASGAATGAMFGGLAPVAGKLIGAGVNSISNAFTGAGGAASKVAQYLTDLGLSPQDVKAELTRLGPAATIADVDPALTLKAQALAANGGQPTSILKNAFTARAADADNRVGQVIDSALGPKPDLTATEDQIFQKAKLAASPFYNAARANPTPMDVTPILNDIESQLDAGAVGGTKANLLKIKGYLTDSTATIPGPNGKPQTMIVPKSDPQSLLAVRQELDDMIQKAGQNPDTTGAKNAVRALNDMRGQIDGVLKADPNIAAGDAAFSQQMRIKDALGQGTDLFTKGVRLEDFNRALASATPDEIEAMRQGARVAIGDAFENARQGQLSAARSMFGKSTANRAKLDALFPNAGDVFDKIAAEQTLRNTENVVRLGSKTAETTAAMNEWKPAQGSSGGSIIPAIAGYAAGGEVGAASAMAARNMFSSAKNAISEASRNRLMGGLAKGYAATGSEQADFLGRVSRAYNAAPATAAITNAGNYGSNLLARVAAQRTQQNPITDLMGSMKDNLLAKAQR